MGITSTLRGGVAAVLAAALSGCASGYHSSQIVGERHFRTPIDTWNVTILRIDGHDWVQRPALVDPGLRKVTVQGPSSPASPQGEVRSIELDVAPCTRYYLAAVRPNALTPDFSIKVDYTEPVSGCTPPPGAR